MQKTKIIPTDLEKEEKELFKFKQEIGKLEGEAYKCGSLSRYFLLIKIMLLECEYDDRALKLAKRLQEAEEKRRNF
jgi:hypothetical protein